MRARIRRPWPILLILSFTILLIYVNQSSMVPATSRLKAPAWAERINGEARQIYQHRAPLSSWRAPVSPSVSAAASADHAPVQWVHGRPRIRQATMLFDGDKDHLRKMYERSLETHIKHGERWAVPTHILRKSLVPEDGSYFNKLAYILSLILTEMARRDKDRAEWIVWFDADTVIMNSAIPWHVFLPPNDFNDKHIIGTRDNNGFNAGVLFFRVNAWNVDVLSQAVALPKLLPKVHLHFFDQSAIGWVCDRPNYEEHFIYQPREWWNRYHHDTAGNETHALNIHFAGLSTVGTGTANKREIMTRYLERVEKSPDTYDHEITKTNYGREINDFWDLLRQSRRLLDRANAYKTSVAAGKISSSPEKMSAVDDALLQLIRLVLKETGSITKIQAANSILHSLLPQSK